MYLTRDEERILDGEAGPGAQLAIRILVKLGDILGAERLIPIASAHVSGVSYKTAGDAAVEFLRELREMGAEAAVPATTNPCGFDERLRDILRLPGEVVRAQEEILSSYEAMRLRKTLTCVPYYETRPESSSHLAWAESSAVAYANSVIGACTNREGAPSALAAAIIGKTPDYGLHRPENRRPELRIRVDFEPEDELWLWALGFLIGELSKGAIPFLENIRALSDWELKGLGASMASGGMVAMFYTPDSPPGAAHVNTGDLELVEIGEEDVRDTIERLSSSDEPDLVFVGCPHCSIEELELLAALLRGREVREDRLFLICTSRYLRGVRPSLIEAIEASGALVIVDTCLVVSWVERLGIDVVATNSPKAAYYLPGLSGVRVRLANLRECVELACPP